MKTYFIIEKSKYNIIKDLVVKSDSLLDRNNAYVLCSAYDNYKELMSRLLNNKIKTRFLEMWITKDVLTQLTGQSIDNFKGLSKSSEITNNQKIFNNILNNKTNSYKPEYYYNYGLMINKVYDKDLNENTLKKFIDTLNLKLKSYNILLNNYDIRPSLLDFFIDSIKEIQLEESKLSKKELEDRNDEFYLNVVAEFIILSSGFYEKEEVKNFISERLLYHE